VFPACGTIDWLLRFTFFASGPHLSLCRVPQVSVSHLGLLALEGGSLNLSRTF